MTLIIALCATLGYLAAVVATGRIWYGHIRPWSEPLACASSYHGEVNRHNSDCYRRYGYVNTELEAAGYAFAVGLTGPLGLIAFGCMALISGRPRRLPEEVQAKIGRLERENRELRGE